MTNRLAQSQSLYLRKHAENPIDWWPWCKEALEKAQQENKPIFLSIGYSSCHWCTVMEGEAFSDNAIAAYMNENFLPIKVDREERPDVDSIYMQTLQLMTGQGGWPLNVFLAPDDRVPFYGGTYFPMDARYGRPGFLQVLQTIRRLYDTDRTQLDSVKTQIMSALQQQLPTAADLSSKLLYDGVNHSIGILSHRSQGPSFPMIPYARSALRGVRFDWTSKLDATPQTYDAEALCGQRGLDLALGGIYDHVGGGFHRYTVDPTWTVPHFEKMLYDNGQIMEYLADLWTVGLQEPAFERAIVGTVQWLKREMTAPEGYFYAAQDADSFLTLGEIEPEEGAFYIWDHARLSELLSEAELQELKEQFTVSPAGNFEGHNVLQRRQPGELSSSLEVTLVKLFAVRYGATPDQVPTFPPARNNQEAKNEAWPGRIPSVTDTKMIVAWNSLMISGLARAAAVFKQAEYLEMAIQAAKFILDNQWLEGAFYRLNYDGKPAVSAQSEDYALFIKALLDLHQASLQVLPAETSAAPYWLTQASQLQAQFDELLWSIELGGYYNTGTEADLVIRERSYDDNATPAANGIAITNLVRLALLTEDLSHLDRAEQALQAFGSVMEKAPQSCPSLFSALDWYRNHTLIRTTADRIVALTDQYLPTAVYTVEAELPEGAVGLVCQGLSCQEPAESEEMLQAQIMASQQQG